MVAEAQGLVLEKVLYADPKDAESPVIKPNQQHSI